MAFSSPETQPDLDAMTKAELLKFAEDHGVTGVSSTMLKADIISTIKGAMGWT
ncbi:hypothetical protein [Paenibacillus ehimensis]|uniref:Rho termination factor N-terminal domain-containing protein n=1 Tax=Paenibacillus ehimensis TaxID=79264 RepID=A0ABT8VHU8_9BACL|nr:hypothetical protein [Paenibacillus ehimensis]MDO3680561.1 hypothetical protein [Paenibacillus ehimensis]